MSGLEMWAGIECSVVRVHERYVDQLALTGHERRASSTYAPSSSARPRSRR